MCESVNTTADSSIFWMYIGKLYFTFQLLLALRSLRMEMQGGVIIGFEVSTDVGQKSLGMENHYWDRKTPE